jgi:urease accessory protein
MLRVARRVSRGTPSDVLSLAYDERKKSRLRVTSERGHEVAITLERGSTLRDGDLLAADSGQLLVVRAAAESVSEVGSADALALMRAAYHLGNRHVPLQIEVGVLRYQHDHVLDGMVRELGLQVSQRMAAFEPERGAYAHAAHAHAGSSHGHDAPAPRPAARRVKGEAPAPARVASGSERSATHEHPRPRVAARAMSEEPSGRSGVER